MEFLLRVSILLIEIFLCGLLIPIVFLREKKLGIFDIFLAGIGVFSFIGMIFFHFNVFQYFFIASSILVAISVFLLICQKNIPLAFENPINWTEICVIILILIFGTFLRLPLSNFIFDIGDAGVYTNSANSLAAFGKPYSEFFPMTQIWLGFFSLLLGSAYTPYGSLFFSLLTSLAFYFFIKEIFKNTKLATLAVLIFSVNILSIWMAKMPYSEIVMLFENIVILWLLIRINTFAKQDNSNFETKKNMVLLSLMLFMTSLTRITALFWMIVLSTSSIINFIFVKDNKKLNLMVFNFSFTAYFLGIIYMIIFRPWYYVTFNLAGYFHEVTAFQIVVAHILLLLFINILYYFFKKDRPILVKLEKIFSGFGASIKEKKSALALAIIIFISIISFGEWILLKNIQSVSVIKFFVDFIDHRIGNHNAVYHIFNYFSFAGFILIPIGFILFLKNYNLFSRKELTPLWIFIIFESAFYLNLNGLATLSHSFYLYYDRYLYSELFIVYILFFVSGLVFLFHQNKWIKSLFLTFLLVYLTHSFIWWSQNNTFEFLGNGYNTIHRISEAIPLKNSIILINRDPELAWFFPNFKRSILLPLHISFGYNVLADEGSPFGNDKVISEDLIFDLLEKNYQVYVLNISENAATTVDISKHKNIIKNEIDGFSTNVAVKKHLPESIFKSNVEKYYFHVSIEKYSIQTIRPQLSRDKGFYPDAFWTDGMGLFDNLNIQVNSRSHLVLLTGGNNPYKNDLNALQMKISLNDISLEFEKQVDNSYYYKIDPSIQTINQIKVESATFVPINLGINSDTRKLGIDIDSIVFE